MNPLRQIKRMVQKSGYLDPVIEDIGKTLGNAVIDGDNRYIQDIDNNPKYYLLPGQVNIHDWIITRLGLIEIYGIEIYSTDISKGGIAKYPLTDEGIKLGQKYNEWRKRQIDRA